MNPKLEHFQLAADTSGPVVRVACDMTSNPITCPPDGGIAGAWGVTQQAYHGYFLDSAWPNGSVAAFSRQEALIFPVRSLLLVVG